MGSLGSIGEITTNATRRVRAGGALRVPPEMTNRRSGGLGITSDKTSEAADIRAKDYAGCGGLRPCGGVDLSHRAIWIGLVTLVVVGATFTVGLVRADDDRLTFIAVLNGANENPERDTRARGVGHFMLSEDGLTMHFKLIASNIKNVVASHIHRGNASVNGGVGQFLFGDAPPAGGAQNGVLAQGSFTNASFIGPFAGRSMAALVALMMTGDVYVNVHTNDGVAPTNTGPGDFPGGEIRGQILPAD